MNTFLNKSPLSLTLSFHMNNKTTRPLIFSKAVRNLHQTTQNTTVFRDLFLLFMTPLGGVIFSQQI